MENFLNENLKRKQENKIMPNRKIMKQDNLEYDLESYNSILFIYKLLGKRAIIRRFYHNVFVENLLMKKYII